MVFFLFLIFLLKTIVKSCMLILTIEYLVLNFKHLRQNRQNLNSTNARKSVLVFAFGQKRASLAYCGEPCLALTYTTVRCPFFMGAAVKVKKFLFFQLKTIRRRCMLGAKNIGQLNSDY